MCWFVPTLETSYDATIFQYYGVFASNNRGFLEKNPRFYCFQVRYDALKQCNRTACPNTGFLDQLEKWYESTIGKVEATSGA